MTSEMQRTTTLFYVDDDAEDLNFFKQATDAIGEPVSLFSLGEEMIYTLKNPPPFPSLVFLDLNMPQRSGYDILKELRQSPAFKDLPVIILSTAFDKATIRTCRELGASMYVPKPPSLKLLKKVIAEVVNIDWSTFTATDETFVLTAA
ncbi:MAG TPA: response regulator [Flavobacterium sp.]|jgi:CheY-like chemotaxis protein